MSDDEDNPFISWGRCFFDNSGNEAPSRYIPCGNANFGHMSCCESQDMCLSSNACYNGQYGVTYLSGCTDQAYKDGSCPNKGSYSGDSWVGLAYCNGTSNEWVACEANRGTNTVTKANSCWCPTTSRTVAFEDASRLANVVSLGTATGETIAWQGGFLPNTATITSTSSVSSSSSLSSTSSVPVHGTETSLVSTAGNATATASTSAPPTMNTSEQESEGHGLSAGAKAGIGVGTGAGSIALAGVLFALIRSSKRKKRLSQEEEYESKPSGAQPVTLFNTQNTHDGDLRSPCWSGHKSELDAVSTASPSPRQGAFSVSKSEVEGSPAIGTAGRPLSNGGFEMPGQKGPVYEMPA